MAGPTVYSAATAEFGAQGGLFEGKKFWLSQKVPSRTHFLNEIRANGGAVVPLEKQADIKIADHARKEILPGTYSYTFIEQSLRKGNVDDLEAHRIGPSEDTVRTVGSAVRPPKAFRNKYTQEDERILWDWVNTNPQKIGGSDGNEIYKQLEMKHPQHPWQSWRDHWIKQLKGRPRPVYPPNNAPPTPPADAQTSTEPVEEQKLDLIMKIEENFDSFSESDAEELLKYGHDIVVLDSDSVESAWTEWARANKSQGKAHTAKRWQSFWEQKVLPRYQKEVMENAKRSAFAKPTIARPSVDPQPPTQASPLRPSINQSANLKEAPVAVTGGRRPTDFQKSLPKPDARTLDARREQQISPTREPESNATSPIGTSYLKRKIPFFEDDLPSDSPPEKSAKHPRTRREGAHRPKEVASTPEGSPSYRRARKASPLFVSTEGDSEDEASISAEEDELGQEPSESLSEPDRTFTGDQGPVREPTPFIELEVPPPSDGWDSQESNSSNRTDEDDEATAVQIEPPDVEQASASQYDSAQEQLTSPLPIRQSHRFFDESADTQAVFDGRTQEPDLGLLDPDGGWDDLIPPSPAAIDTHSESNTAANSPKSSSDDLEAQLDAWLFAQATSSGFSESDVQEVLERSCMDSTLASRVLEEMRREWLLTDSPNGDDGDGDDGDGDEEQPTLARYLPQDKKGVWTDEDDRDLHDTDARKVKRVYSKHGPDYTRAREEMLQCWREIGDDNDVDDDKR